jgi:hypothetical protein
LVIRYPVLASHGCEADHGLLYVVFGEFAFSLADQIDDSLMCIDILPPGGPSLAAIKTNRVNGSVILSNA